MNINKKLKKYVYLAHLFKCLIVLFNLKNELDEKNGNCPECGNTF